MTSPANDETTLATLRGPDVSATQMHRLVTVLLADDPVTGVAAVFDLLASPPRIKPTRGLLIDPGDDTRRRWDCRVAAAAALLQSPHAARVADELIDELRADIDLEADVLVTATPHASVRAFFDV